MEVTLRFRRCEAAFHDRHCEAALGRSMLTYSIRIRCEIDLLLTMTIPNGITAEISGELKAIYNAYTVFGGGKSGTRITF